MKDIIALVLAAGEGKRMKSKNSKVTHRICGKPMIEWVADCILGAGVKESIFVVGHRADQVKECLGEKVHYALQENQLGTGHAVMQAKSILESKRGTLVILYGDMPLVTSNTLKNAILHHQETNHAATVITATLSDPSGYGRIYRNGDGSFNSIVEDRDTSEEQKAIHEINTGIYCFNIQQLLMALNELGNNNSQGEYYLTDTLEILLNKGLKVGTIKAGDSSEFLGINDRVQLYEASEILKKRILFHHMREGVTIIDPNTTYIDPCVVIGKDTVVYPGSIIEGQTVIGEDCIIGPNSKIYDSIIKNNVEISYSVVLESSIDDLTKVGPFAYIRPGCEIGKDIKIGDFVEVKNSKVGDHTKFSHLTYVGDAEIGENVNLGCGVVVVNYDGKKKYKTVVGDNAFVGCNTNLISPVVVHKNTYIAAGSTITDEVPEHSLAIARSRQMIKENWVINRDMLRNKNGGK